MPLVHVLFRTVQFGYKRKDDSVQIHETRLLKECAPELDGPAMFIVGIDFLYRQFNNNICLSRKRRVFVRGYGCYSSLRFSGQPCNITGYMGLCQNSFTLPINHPYRYLGLWRLRHSKHLNRYG